MKRTAFTAGVMLCLLSSAAAAQDARPAPDSAGRVANLLRFWTEVRLFGMAPGAGGAPWERALAEAAPAALAAPDDAALTRVARTMLGRIDSTPQGDTVVPSTAPPLRIENGAAVVGCATFGAGLAGGRMALLEELAAAKAEEIVFDCRGIETASPEETETRAVGFDYVAANIWRRLLTAPVALGASRKRYWDGFPPDIGTTSGGYETGTIDVSAGTMLPVPAPAPSAAPASAPFAARRAALIVDGGTVESGVLAARFRAVFPEGPVIRVGGVGDGATTSRNGALVMRYRASDLVPVPGAPPRRADLCLAPADGEAVAAALRIVRGAPGRSCPDAADAHDDAAVAPASAAAAPDAVPPLGQRMVALARLWGTIRYFHPYETLNDAKWDAALAQYVPVFAAASTRAAYDDAVRRMTALVDDSHVGVGGTVTGEGPFIRSFQPPLRLQSVGERLVVIRPPEPKTEMDLRRGDVIASVDGMTPAQWAARYRPLLALSTPATLRERRARGFLAGPKDTMAVLSVVRAGRTLTRSVKRTTSSRLVSDIPLRRGDIWRTVAPGIGYIDLARLTGADVDKAMDAMIGKKALVLDMRGYPNGTAWAIAPRLARPGREEAVDALFSRPTYRGPGRPQTMATSFPQRLPASNSRPRFAGKVLVLIDENAISQSEHSVLMYKAAAPVTVIGTPSQGANGDVTNVALPGGLNVGFSGHDVRWADGKRLQRVGIVPDIAVAPTVAGLAAGRDEPLERAIREAGRR